MTTKTDTMTTKTQKTPVLKMTLQVLSKVISTIGCQKSESGGILGSADDVITHFHFDNTSKTTCATYTPDTIMVNDILKQEWNPNDIRLVAFPHSHPGQSNKPSHGDLIYGKLILDHIEDMELLWIPIINTIPDTGKFTITPWAVCRTEDGVELVRGNIQIESPVALDKETSELMPSMELFPLREPLDKIEINADNLGWSKKTPSEDKTDDILARVAEAYDRELMKNTQIGAVGVGGAAEWLEQMARCGVRRFLLIDPDTVSETNIGTQQTYLKDVGRPKVDCIAERIRDINPSAKVLKIQKKLEDIPYEILRELILAKSAHPSPHQTILCGLTDNFYAQAQVNRIALQLGVPSLCAQVYKEGRGAEITFTYPGVTPACHRCILSSRYQYYLEEENENDVTSYGTPIFATALLNAIKGYITLALIHHGSEHKRWGKTLTRIGNRNLVQIRLCPDISDELGIPTFDKVFENSDNERLFFGEPVWLPQEQECPETGYPNCPDCGGTGDLRDAIGSFESTQLPHLVKSKEEDA